MAKSWFLTKLRSPFALKGLVGAALLLGWILWFMLVMYINGSAGPVRNPIAHLMGTVAVLAIGSFFLAIRISPSFRKKMIAPTRAHWYEPREYLLVALLFYGIGLTGLIALPLDMGWV